MLRALGGRRRGRRSGDADARRRRARPRWRCRRSPPAPTACATRPRTTFGATLRDAARSWSSPARAARRWRCRGARWSERAAVRGRRDRARCWSTPGFAGAAAVLEIYRGGERVERRRLDRRHGRRGVELPVARGDRGGFARARCRRARPPARAADQRGVRALGRQGAEGRVRDLPRPLRPGAKETWRVTVKGADGQRGRGRRRRAARLHVRPQPRPVRAAPAAGAAGALSRTAPARPACESSLRRRRRRPGRERRLAAAAGARRRCTADRLRFLDGYGIGGPGARGTGDARRRRDGEADGVGGRRRRAGAGAAAGAAAGARGARTTRCGRQRRSASDGGARRRRPRRPPPPRAAQRTSPRPPSGSRTCSPAPDGTATHRVHGARLGHRVERLGARADRATCARGSLAAARRAASRS